MTDERRVEEYVESLLQDRQPRRFAAGPEDAEILRVAAELRALRSGADLPRREFIDSLRARLAQAGAGGDERRGVSRRSLLAGGAAAAAALVAGVGLDRTLGDHVFGDTTPPAPTGPGELNPNAPRWVAVAQLDSLMDNAATRFSAGAVEGFLIRRGETVEAMSAVCTHMGCILRFNAPGARLDCPCHAASFGLDGVPINHGYLSSLPRIESRVTGGGGVEVRVTT
jgi:nitrite reductase/ring-hydroxylating ferredoxin subunit